MEVKMEFNKKNEIVDHVFTIQEIEETKWTLSHLFSLLFNNELHTAASLGLVNNTSFCESCEMYRVLFKNAGKIDGWAWACSICKSRATVRKDSFLEGSHLRIQKVVILLYCWSLEMPQGKIQKEIDVAEHTIVDWMNLIREICEQDILDHPVKLGGIDEKSNNPKDVEINKSYFFNRKYSRGRYKDEEVLIFQVFERMSKLSNLTTVKSRDRSALFPIIRSWLLPGTRIVSDGWADYEGLEKFEHRIIKKTPSEKCTDPIIETLWRRRANGEVFPRILKCIRQQYSS